PGVDRAGGGEKRRGGALRALGRDQPGCDGHRARPATAPGDRADRARSRRAFLDARRAGRETPAHAARGTDLAAAGAAGDFRAESRGLAERDRTALRAPARARAAAARGPVRRRGGDAGLARLARRGSRRGAGRGAEACHARSSLACTTRQRRRIRRRARAAGRHAGEDRARRVAARAERGRRGARAGRAGPRRILHVAAQTQPGRLRGGAGCGNAAPRTGVDDARCDGAGTRARARRLARGVGDAAGDLPARRGRAGAYAPGSRRTGDRSRAHAREPRSHPRPDPRRGGDDGARRAHRPFARASARGAGLPARGGRGTASARRARRGCAGAGTSRRRGTGPAVRSYGLPRRGRATGGARAGVAGRSMRDERSRGLPAPAAKPAQTGMREDRPPTVAQSLLECAARLGVEYVFTNLGSDHPAFIEAFARLRERGATTPKAIVCPHEMTALSAAHGYAMIARRPQLVLVHVDVGTQNLGGSVHNAARGRVPALIVAGLSPLTAGTRVGARNEFIHYIQDTPRQHEIVGQYVKWAYELRAPEMAEAVLLRAMQVASTPPEGPIYLTGAREIWDARVPAAPESAADWPPSRLGG